MRLVNRNSNIANKDWLPDLDLNQDKQIQSLLCYRYTIGQAGACKLDAWRWESRFVEPLNRYTVEPDHPRGAARFTIQRFNDSTIQPA